MGLVPAFVHLLLGAKQRGVSFERTLTLGRQQWYVPDGARRALAREFGVSEPDAPGLEYEGFSDGFFRHWLAATDLVSLDASAFEGATLIHDLNQPVPRQWHQTYDVIVDGGTLEHVFQFPTALESCLRMLKVGGSMFGFTPANNYCGHGFYQFSPELIFRIFSEESGFRIEQLYLVTHPFPGGELSPRIDFYSVRDPREVQSRVGLVNSRPAAIVYEAVRTGDLPIFPSGPHQGDYSLAWKEGRPSLTLFHGEAGSRWAKFANGLAVAAAARVPRPFRNWLGGLYQRHWLCSLRNSRLYRRLRLRP